MKNASFMALLTCGLLTGCLTEQDKAARLAFDSRPQLGVTFVPEWLTENDIVVQDVPAGSAAAQAGLQSRDTIVSFNGRKVATIHDLNQIETQLQHGQTVSVGILRNQKPIAVAVTLQ